MSFSRLMERDRAEVSALFGATSQIVFPAPILARGISRSQKVTSGKRRHRRAPDLGPSPKLKHHAVEPCLQHLIALYPGASVRWFHRNAFRADQGHDSVGRNARMFASTWSRPPSSPATPDAQRLANAGSGGCRGADPLDLELPRQGQEPDRHGQRSLSKTTEPSVPSRPRRADPPCPASAGRRRTVVSVGDWDFGIASGDRRRHARQAGHLGRLGLTRSQDRPRRQIGARGLVGPRAPGRGGSTSATA